MHVHARLVLGLFGLVLAVPALVVAAPLGDGAPPVEEVSATPPPHRHTGLFGWRHCVTCQRARAKAESGVNVPPPPPLGPGPNGSVPVAATAGPFVSAHDHSTHASESTCAACQGQVVVTGPTVIADGHAPGYAVVGEANAAAPGYAVVGGPAGPGADPTPIGVARNSQPPWADPRMAAMGARPGSGSSPYDPAVRPTSLPPGQTAMPDSGHNSRTSIIAHAIGFPKLGQHRREREDKERQKHAAIVYGDSSRSVDTLPASMVYGKGSH